MDGSKRFYLFLTLLLTLTAASGVSAYPFMDGDPLRWPPKIWLPGNALPPFAPNGYPFGKDNHRLFVVFSPEGVPPPCATWDNGGLAWDNLIENEWWVRVEMPRFRFCGVPHPYPPKPEADPDDD